MRFHLAPLVAGWIEYDNRAGTAPVEHRGRVPAGSIVVPGTRPKQFPAGIVDLQCAYIIGHRSERHDEKLVLNQTLRDLGVQL